MSCTLCSNSRAQPVVLYYWLLEYNRQLPEDCRELDLDAPRRDAPDADSVEPAEIGIARCVEGLPRWEPCDVRERIGGE